MRRRRRRSNNLAKAIMFLIIAAGIVLAMNPEFQIYLNEIKYFAISSAYSPLLWVGACVFILAIFFRPRFVAVPFYKLIRRREVKGGEWGYVYILTNPSMPDLVKIGFTVKHPKERAKELQSTGVPTAFRVYYFIESKYARRVEAQSHRLLDKERIAKEREFMRCDPARAAAVIKLANEQVERALKG